jgi:hypothetical protein
MGQINPRDLSAQKWSVFINSNGEVRTVRAAVHTVDWQRCSALLLSDLLTFPFRFLAEPHELHLQQGTAREESAGEGRGGTRQSASQDSKGSVAVAWINSIHRSSSTSHVISILHILSLTCSALRSSTC